MTSEGGRPSDCFIERIRTVRAFRRLTQEEVAEGITRFGYPMSKIQYRHFENGRRKEVPYDFVVATTAFFNGAPRGGADIYEFLYGPLCRNCNDDPPRRYACLTCHRHRNRNDEGEVVSC